MSQSLIHIHKSELQGLSLRFRLLLSSQCKQGGLLPGSTSCWVMQAKLSCCSRVMTLFFFHNSMSLSTKHSGHNMAFSQLLKSWQVFGKLLPALLVLLAHKIPPSTPMQSSLFCSSNLAAWPASSSFVSMCPLMCLACLSNCQHHWLTKREILNLQMHFPAWTKYQQFYEAFQLFG